MSRAPAIDSDFAGSRWAENLFCHQLFQKLFCAPRRDSGRITSYPEVMTRHKLSTRARSRLRGHVPKTRQTQEEAVGAISSRFLNRNSQSLAEIARPTLCPAVSRD